VCLPQPPHCGQRGSGSHPGLLGLCVWGGCVLLGQASGCCPWGTSGALLACAFTPIFATTLRGPSLLHPSVWMSRQAESKGCSSKELLASGASQSQLHVSIYFFFPLALSSAWGFCCASLAGSQKGFSVWTGSGEVEALCGCSPSSAASWDGDFIWWRQTGCDVYLGKRVKQLPVHWRNDGQGLARPEV